MKHPFVAIALAIGLALTGVLLFPTGARAHEQETSVDWEVAYANIRVLSAPVFTHTSTVPGPTGSVPACPSGQNLDPCRSSGVGPAYPTIMLDTGEYLIVTWGFQYVGQGRAGTPIRGDLFWITRLGLDFGTLGRYVNGQWIGGRSFELVPNAFYNATLVIRSIQPTFRHLHVGVAVQDVGNIPAAPTTLPLPPGGGGPTLYGVFTDASGPVFEPLQGITVDPFGTNLQMIAPWPWAVASLFGQIVIGFAFIGIMWWYARWERKRGARA